MAAPKMIHVRPELRQHVADLVAAHGVSEASRRAGIGKQATLSVVARGVTTAGCAVLLERCMGGQVAPRPRTTTRRVVAGFPIHTMAGAAAAMRGGRTL